MAILRYILCAVPALMLTGCYADFDPETDTKPLLCLNSLITARKPITVDVTHTWLFTDEKARKNHKVTDAVVNVIANDEVVGSDYLPAEGDNIRIVADSPTYGTASAEVEVPHALHGGNVKVRPEVTDIWVSPTALAHGLLSGRISFRLAVEVDVNDPADEENYYDFSYNWHYPSSDKTDDNIYSGAYGSVLSIGGLNYHSEPIFREHISLFEAIMGNGLDTEFFLFSDRQINGKTYPLHLNFENCYFSIDADIGDEVPFDCGIDVYLFSVSKSFYNWSLYNWNEHTGILIDLADLGLAEAKWGYSNVSTGAGVVAATSGAVFKVDLKDFLMQAVAEYIQQE